MTHQNLIKKYNLEEAKLFDLFNAIVRFLEEKGVNVFYIDLHQAIEVDVYKVDRNIKNEDKHHETCLSNGMEVWLHHDLDEVGGITGRLYDILHVGCGHLWQWSANNKSNLDYYGNKAWKIGSRSHLGATKEELHEVWRYEKEAGKLALANLKNILKKNSRFSPAFAEAFIQLFNDYMSTDLDYIIDYYRTGRIKNFFDKWQYESTPFEEISTKYPFKLQKRSNKCISLITNRA